MRPAAANIAGGSLSPSDEVLQLGGEGYSPGLLKKIEYAGGNHRSFTMAADGLEVLAEQAVSARHVERLTERLGRVTFPIKNGRGSVRFSCIGSRRPPASVTHQSIRSMLTKDRVRNRSMWQTWPRNRLASSARQRKA